jgi:phage terminase large subunit
MLKISRPDVDCEAITEFPADKRFIKLPIANYLKLLGIYDSINRPQIALINAVNDPKYRFVCAALARRLGKTYIANVVAQLVTLVPGSNVLIMSPNYNLSGISFELQRRLIKHFDLEVARDNLKDKIIELENGSTIRMGSLSTVDSCVGRSYDMIIFDEAALGSDGEAAFNVALRPTLDKPGAKAIFISTPRGQNNWFSQFWNRGFDPEFPEWVSLQADYTENSRMQESDVAEARRSMSRAEFEQEYLASFSVFEGQIYQLDEDSAIVGYIPGDGDEVFGGVDPGYRDPTAFAVISYNPREGVFHVVDEYLKSEAPTDKHAEAFQELIARWGADPIFIDSAAPQFASDLAYLYDIPTIKAKKDVLPGIAYVQTLVETGRLRVAPHCTHTIAMLRQYRWDTKETLTKEKPVHDQYSHMADAIRYALYTYTL